MARVVQSFGEQRVMRGPENRIMYVHVFRLDCGCSMEVDARGYDPTDMVANAADAHRCQIVFLSKVYDPVRIERPMTRWAWDGPAGPTYMGVPISSGPTYAMREFYSEVRAPARPPANSLGFKPEQLDALKTKITEPAKLKSKIKLDRFDLIEID